MEAKKIENPFDLQSRVGLVLRTYKLYLVQCSIERSVQRASQASESNPLPIEAYFAAQHEASMLRKPTASFGLSRLWEPLQWRAQA